MAKSNQHYLQRIWYQPCIQWEIYKTKIKLENKKFKINFHGKKIPNESLEYVSLSVILFDSVYRKDNKYCP